MTVRAAVEARAVTCRTRAGGVTVRDVSLTVDQGELVGIIGGSGSGKSTLLAALSGLHPPTAGTVQRYPDRQAGYVPAGDSMAPVLPLARALRYTGAMRGVGGANGDAVDDALDLAGLAAAASSPVGTLNPGERKRAEIAAELLASPAALFLDDASRYTLPVSLQQSVGGFDPDWGAFAAGSLLVSLPVVLAFFLVQRKLAGGLAAGAVKG